MSNETRNEGLWEEINTNRDFMKCPDFSKFMPNSDQSKELPQPPLHPKAKGEVIEISADFEKAVTTDSYTKLLDVRRSLRTYDPDKAMTKDQLAFLLWSTQGIQEVRGGGYAALRPVPSGGARHPFETYFFARNVEGLNPGIYRYLPDEHIGEKKVSVEFITSLSNHEESVSEMLADQKWAIHAPVVVYLTCIAYRAEWRYSTMAHRVILIDLGHAGQNLMLSAEAMGLGSCCIAAYDQKLCDDALGVDGYEEYTVYACTVGNAKA
ncbi:MAG: SagB/ThcOx family dehydrogenase [Oscillospiraceae bacterium]|nr:SagB/ThcOx family dehydrogenase [Oscillospiraceae bacterium]